MWLDSKLECYTADARQLSQDLFPDEFYDGVSSMLVLPLIKDTEGYLHEHYRVTKDGGTFVVSGPPENPGDLSKSIEWWGELLKRRDDFQEIEQHWTRVKKGIDKNREKLYDLYSKEEVAGLVEDCGFTVEEVRENPLHLNNKGYLVTATK